MFKKILVGMLILFVLIQFYRPAKNISAQTQPADISTLHPLPDTVQSILKRSCYDCHSNNTHYPWYAEIQPVRWWLDDHIDEGKRELNFNEFAGYSPRRRYIKLEQTIKEVKEGEMPLDSYTFIHTDAKLSEPEKQALYTWAQAIRDTMKATYPADSLARKNRPQPKT